MPYEVWLENEEQARLALDSNQVFGLNKMPARLVPQSGTGRPKINSFTIQPFDHSTTFILRFGRKAMRVRIKKVQWTKS
ncbi:MAG: hypothetical protein B6I32_02060 [Desulfobacterium sp. 4572_20]|nr:MAG: hypothetical protein B6I32_02060 [Desulfobacterium sp. 4572_20]